MWGAGGALWGLCVWGGGWAGRLSELAAEGRIGRRRRGLAGDDGGGAHLLHAHAVTWLRSAVTRLRSAVPWLIYRDAVAWRGCAIMFPAYPHSVTQSRHSTRKARDHGSRKRRMGSSPTLPGGTPGHVPRVPCISDSDTKILDTDTGTRIKDSDKGLG